MDTQQVANYLSLTPSEPLTAKSWSGLAGGEPRPDRSASEGTITCDVWQTVQGFEQVKELWSQLSVDPMASFAWNQCWWKAFSNSGELHLIQFRQGNVPVGIGPFYVDRWFGLKRFRFLATGKTCTDYVDLVCEPAYYAACVNSLAQYLSHQDFDIIELDCINDDRLAEQIQSDLESKYGVECREAEPTWCLTLPESWQQFCTDAKKHLRRKLNKAQSRIDSGAFKIVSSIDAVGVDEAFATFKELHIRRCMTKGQKGVFADSHFEEFLESVIEEFGLNHTCEIVIVEHGGKAIGAQLYFRARDGFQLYQSGYCPDAMKFEPGHMLFASMVQRGIERGDRYFDFLRGNEPYKSFWGAHTRRQKKWRLISKRLLPTVVSTCVAGARGLVRRS